VQDLSPTANNPAENVLERRAILVAGWGRSGTSALARVLNLCGATLPNRLLPPGPDNETGFWEPAEVVRILEEAFESVGASWRDVAEFPRAWFGSEVSGQFRRRLVAALREDYGDSPLFVVKHPLIGHLVPLWLAALEELGTTPLFVIPVRNPLAVAASFRKRDGFEDAHTLQLWLRHYLAAERDTRGSKRVFITYEHLLNDWRSTVHRIGRRLGVEWPRPFCEGEVESFLSPARQHHRFTPQDVYARPEVAPWVKTLFDWTSRAASDLPANSQELDAVHSELRAADVAFIPLLVASYAGQQRLSAEHRDLQARLEATSRELGESDQRTRALEAKYAEAIRILISALNREQRRLDSISPLIPQNGQTVPLSCDCPKICDCCWPGTTSPSSA